MFEKLGSKKYAVPLVVSLVVACVMSFMFYPMAHMEMKGLPFAVLSLDEGVQTPQGAMNAGDTIVENMTSVTESAAGASSPISWVKVASQEELDEGFSDARYYGALIVPADFTVKQVAAKQAEATQAAEAEAPALRVVIDNAKSPLVATQMQASITTMFQQMGMSVEVETIHAGAVSSESGSTSTNPMSGMMSLQLTIAPLFIMSMAGALVLNRLFGKKRAASNSDRWKALGIQVAYSVVASLVAGLCVYAMLTWVAGIEASAVDFILFAWLASFCVMLLFLGLYNLSFGLGVLVAVLALTGGTMAGVLPFEALPVFWQDWIYPWVPQRFMGEGVRAVLYLEAGAWNGGSGPLAIIGVIGVALGCLAALLPKKAAPAHTSASEEVTA